MLRWLGWKFDYGATRMVLLTSKYAIKVPTVRHGWIHFLYGLLANMQERRLWHAWSEIDDSKAMRLAPVLWSIPGGWLVVQERAYVPRNYRRKFTFEKVYELAPLFNGLPTDIKPSNFGFIGRRLVMVDYGS